MERRDIQYMITKDLGQRAEAVSEWEDKCFHKQRHSQYTEEGSFPERLKSVQEPERTNSPSAETCSNVLVSRTKQNWLNEVTFTKNHWHKLGKIAETVFCQPVQGSTNGCTSKRIYHAEIKRQALVHQRTARAMHQGGNDIPMPIVLLEKLPANFQRRIPELIANYQKTHFDRISKTMDRMKEEHHVVELKSEASTKEQSGDNLRKNIQTYNIQTRKPHERKPPKHSDYVSYGVKHSTGKKRVKDVQKDKLNEAPKATIRTPQISFSKDRDDSKASAMVSSRKRLNDDSDSLPKLVRWPSKNQSVKIVTSSDRRTGSRESIIEKGKTKTVNLDPHMPKLIDGKSTASKYEKSKSSTQKIPSIGNQGRTAPNKSSALGSRSKEITEKSDAHHRRQTDKEKKQESGKSHLDISKQKPASSFHSSSSSASHHRHRSKSSHTKTHSTHSRHKSSERYRSGHIDKQKSEGQHKSLSLGRCKSESTVSISDTSTLNTIPENKSEMSQADSSESRMKHDISDNAQQGASEENRDISSSPSGSPQIALTDATGKDNGSLTKKNKIGPSSPLRIEPVQLMKYPSTITSKKSSLLDFRFKKKEYPASMKEERCNSNPTNAKVDILSHEPKSIKVIIAQTPQGSKTKDSEIVRGATPSKVQISCDGREQQIKNLITIPSQEDVNVPKEKGFDLEVASKMFKSQSPKLLTTPPVTVAHDLTEEQSNLNPPKDKLHIKDGMEVLKHGNSETQGHTRTGGSPSKHRNIKENDAKLHVTEEGSSVVETTQVKKWDKHQVTHIAPTDMALNIKKPHPVMLLNHTLTPLPLPPHDIDIVEDSEDWVITKNNSPSSSEDTHPNTDDEQQQLNPDNVNRMEIVAQEVNTQLTDASLQVDANTKPNPLKGLEHDFENCQKTSKDRKAGQENSSHNADGTSNEQTVPSVATINEIKSSVPAETAAEQEESAAEVVQLGQFQVNQQTNVNIDKNMFVATLTGHTAINEMAIDTTSSAHQESSDAELNKKTNQEERKDQINDKSVSEEQDDDLELHMCSGPGESIIMVEKSPPKQRTTVQVLRVYEPSESTLGTIGQDQKLFSQHSEENVELVETRPEKWTPQKTVDEKIEGENKIKAEEKTESHGKEGSVQMLVMDLCNDKQLPTTTAKSNIDAKEEVKDTLKGFQREVKNSSGEKCVKKEETMKTELVTNREIKSTEQVLFQCQLKNEQLQIIPSESKEEVKTIFRVEPETDTQNKEIGNYSSRQVTSRVLYQEVKSLPCPEVKETGNETEEKTSEVTLQAEMPSFYPEMSEKRMNDEGPQIKTDAASKENIKSLSDEKSVISPQGDDNDIAQSKTDTLKTAEGQTSDENETVTTIRNVEITKDKIGDQLEANIDSLMGISRAVEDQGPHIDLTENTMSGDSTVQTSSNRLPVNMNELPEGKGINKSLDSAVNLEKDEFDINMSTLDKSSKIVGINEHIHDPKKKVVGEKVANVDESIEISDENQKEMVSQGATEPTVDEIYDCKVTEEVSQKGGEDATNLQISPGKNLEEPGTEINTSSGEVSTVYNTDTFEEINPGADSGSSTIPDRTVDPLTLKIDCVMSLRHEEYNNLNNAPFTCDLTHVETYIDVDTDPVLVIDESRDVVENSEMTGEIYSTPLQKSSSSSATNEAVLNMDNRVQSEMREEDAALETLSDGCVKHDVSTASVPSLNRSTPPCNQVQNGAELGNNRDSLHPISGEKDSSKDISMAVDGNTPTQSSILNDKSSKPAANGNRSTPTQSILNDKTSNSTSEQEIDRCNERKQQPEMEVTDTSQARHCTHELSMSNKPSQPDQKLLENTRTNPQSNPEQAEDSLLSSREKIVDVSESLKDNDTCTESMNKSIQSLEAKHDEPEAKSKINGPNPDTEDAPSSNICKRREPEMPRLKTLIVRLSSRTCLDPNNIKSQESEKEDEEENKTESHGKDAGADRVQKPPPTKRYGRPTKVTKRFQHKVSGLSEKGKKEAGPRKKKGPSGKGNNILKRLRTEPGTGKKGLVVKIFNTRARRRTWADGTTVTNYEETDFGFESDSSAESGSNVGKAKILRSSGKPVIPKPITKRDSKNLIKGKKDDSRNKRKAQGTDKNEKGKNSKGQGGQSLKSATSEVAAVKRRNETDDSTLNDLVDLPTILPPKRKRSNSEKQCITRGQQQTEQRLSREFPQHNWLEKKLADSSMKLTKTNSDEDTQSKSPSSNTETATETETNDQKETNIAVKENEETDKDPDNNSQCPNKPSIATENDVAVNNDGTESARLEYDKEKKTLPTDKHEESEMGLQSHTVICSIETKDVGGQDLNKPEKANTADPPPVATTPDVIVIEDTPLDLCCKKSVPEEVEIEKLDTSNIKTPGVFTCKTKPNAPVQKVQPQIHQLPSAASIKQSTIPVEMPPLIQPTTLGAMSVQEPELTNINHGTSTLVQRTARLQPVSCSPSVINRNSNVSGYTPARENSTINHTSTEKPAEIQVTQTYNSPVVTSTIYPGNKGISGQRVMPPLASPPANKLLPHAQLILPNVTHANPRGPPPLLPMVRVPDQSSQEIKYIRMPKQGSIASQGPEPKFAKIIPPTQTRQIRPPLPALMPAQGRPQNAGLPSAVHRSTSEHMTNQQRMTYLVPVQQHPVHRQPMPVVLQQHQVPQLQQQYLPQSPISSNMQIYQGQNHVLSHSDPVQGISNTVPTADPGNGQNIVSSIERQASSGLARPCTQALGLQVEDSGLTARSSDPVIEEFERKLSEIQELALQKRKEYEELTKTCEMMKKTLYELQLSNKTRPTQMTYPATNIQTSTAQHIVHAYSTPNGRLPQQTNQLCCQSANCHNEKITHVPQGNLGQLDIRKPPPSYEASLSLRLPTTCDKHRQRIPSASSPTITSPPPAHSRQHQLSTGMGFGSSMPPPAHRSSTDQPMSPAPNPLQAHPNTQSQSLTTPGYSVHTPRKTPVLTAPDDFKPAKNLHNTNNVRPPPAHGQRRNSMIDASNATSPSPLSSQRTIVSGQTPVQGAAPTTAVQTNLKLPLPGPVHSCPMHGGASNRNTQFPDSSGIEDNQLGDNSKNKNSTITAAEIIDALLVHQVQLSDQTHNPNTLTKTTDGSNFQGPPSCLQTTDVVSSVGSATISIKSPIVQSPSSLNQEICSSSISPPALTAVSIAKSVHVSVPLQGRSDMKTPSPKRTELSVIYSPIPEVQHFSDQCASSIPAVTVDGIDVSESLTAEKSTVSEKTQGSEQQNEPKAVDILTAEKPQESTEMPQDNLSKQETAPGSVNNLNVCDNNSEGMNQYVTLINSESGTPSKEMNSLEKLAKLTLVNRENIVASSMQSVPLPTALKPDKFPSESTGEANQEQTNTMQDVSLQEIPGDQREDISVIYQKDSDSSSSNKNPLSNDSIVSNQLDEPFLEDSVQSSVDNLDSFHADLKKQITETQTDLIRKYNSTVTSSEILIQNELETALKRRRARQGRDEMIINERKNTGDCHVIQPNQGQIPSAVPYSTGLQNSAPSAQSSAVPHSAPPKKTIRRKSGQIPSIQNIAQIRFRPPIVMAPPPSSQQRSVRMPHNLSHRMQRDNMMYSRPMVPTPQRQQGQYRPRNIPEDMAIRKPFVDQVSVSRNKHPELERGLRHVRPPALTHFQQASTTHPVGTYVISPVYQGAPERPQVRYISPEQPQSAVAQRGPGPMQQMVNMNQSIPVHFQHHQQQQNLQHLQQQQQQQQQSMQRFSNPNQGELQQGQPGQVYHMAGQIVQEPQPNTINNMGQIYQNQGSIQGLPNLGQQTHVPITQVITNQGATSQVNSGPSGVPQGNMIQVIHHPHSVSMHNPTNMQYIRQGNPTMPTNQQLHVIQSPTRMSLPGPRPGSIQHGASVQGPAPVNMGIMNRMSGPRGAIPAMMQPQHSTPQQMQLQAMQHQQQQQIPLQHHLQPSRNMPVGPPPPLQPPQHQQKQPPLLPVSGPLSGRQTQPTTIIIDDDDEDDGHGNNKSVAPTKTCDICQKVASFLCSGCQQVWYCGIECQMGAWAKHSETCALNDQN